MSAEAARLLLTLVLLGASGLFSASEIALLALSRRRAVAVAGPGSAVVERLLARPAATLGAILITITALNYTVEALAASTVVARLELPVWVAAVGMGLAVVILAEVVPISYAAANPERVARAGARPVWLVTRVLALPAFVLGWLAERLARVLGARPVAEEPVTEGEVRAMVDLQAEAGGLEEEEKAMIHHIFEFGEKTAREVMVPRPDMAAISVSATAREAGQLATERRVSRLPVYEDDLDHIVGVVYVKDVLPLLAAGQGERPVRSVMREPFRVPETKKLSDLLTDFRRHRRTFAVVVDEYGGTSGLVTMEDLLEEVVGDIYDEYDVVRPWVQQVEEGVLLLDGRLSVAEASEALGVALPEGSYDSVAGLVYRHLGAVPQVGQQLALPGVTLVVEQLEGHRISRVRAVRQTRGEEAGGALDDG